MFLAMIADGKATALWREGQEKLKELTLSPLLDEFSVGGPLGAR